jgi:hypothetical protein
MAEELTLADFTCWCWWVGSVKAACTVVDWSQAAQAAAMFSQLWMSASKQPQIERTEAISLLRSNQSSRPLLWTIRSSVSSQRYLTNSSPTANTIRRSQQKEHSEEPFSHCFASNSIADSSQEELLAMWVLRQQPPWIFWGTELGIRLLFSCFGCRVSLAKSARSCQIDHWYLKRSSPAETKQFWWND